MLVFDTNVLLYAADEGSEYRDSGPRRSDLASWLALRCIQRFDGAGPRP